MSAEMNSNPYVGLRPFEIDESILFFGRNEQTLELLQRLHQHHFVAVVGSSGCGKSSLLRAGLIPALKAGYLVDDSDHWFIAITKPGQSPLYNMAEAMLQQIDLTTNPAEVSALVQKINEEGADAILELITPFRKEQNTNFFLLIDQFEELFRFGMNQKDVARKDEAIDFVNILLELAQQSSIPFYIVLTMRSDFIGDCDQFYGLPEAMNKSQYLVPRLNRVQLKTVIEGPAKLYGGKINPSLTSRLLNELGKVKDELPLLQHALMRIWGFENTVNKSGELDLGDYEKIGGIEKALSYHADEALSGMSEADLKITKALFQALTAIDENGRKIRRPVLLSQLIELTGATKEQLHNIINLFIKDRRSFLVINKTGDTGDKIIDISHESLIRQWNTLGQWVDEEGESASIYLQLSEAYKLYKQKKKDFLTGSELHIALDWYTKFKPIAAWANRYQEGFEESEQYLIASEKEQIAKQKQEQDRQKQEKSSKQKQRGLLIGISLLMLLATAAVFMVLKSKMLTKQADASAQEANKQKLLADSSAVMAYEQQKNAENYAEEAIRQQHLLKKKQDTLSYYILQAREETQNAEQAEKEAKEQKRNAEKYAREAENYAELISNEAAAELEFQSSENNRLKSQSDRVKKNNEDQKIRLNSIANDALTNVIVELSDKDSSSVQKLKKIQNDLMNVSSYQFTILKKFQQSDTAFENNGSFLEPGQAIQSKNEKYMLAYQDDGDLVIYRKNGMEPIWSSGTTGYPAYRAIMQYDGNLVIYYGKPYQRGEKSIWASNTWENNNNAHLVLEDNGNLVIYNSSNKAVWQSNSVDK